LAITLTAATTAFQQTLDAEGKAIQQFVGLLQLEQVALSTGKIEDLPAFIDKKAELAARLNALATQRNHSLAEQGFAADRAGVESWCAKNPQERSVDNAWQRILSLANEARELNRLNGELIQIRMQYNAKALEALQGGKNSFDLYGPDGQSTAPIKRRISDAV
jgi:flagellar biosynthesis protein FlgN